MKVKFEENEMFTEWSCGICRKLFTLTPIVALAEIDEKKLGYICPDCADRNAEEIKKLFAEEMLDLKKEILWLQKQISTLEEVDNTGIEEFKEMNRIN